MDGKYYSFTLIAFACLLGLLLFQGTTGIFYLDDFSNLSRLELIKDQPNGWIAFLFEDRIGPIGRPISLLTFALQHNSWPNHPFDFKIINLLLHIINSIFITIICNKLLSIYFKNQKKIFNISLLIGFIWAASPIQFTNIFYVIQRMNILSSTFLLAAIYIYIQSRVNFSFFSTAKKTLTIASAFFIISLSLLSKENGILYFCYLLVIEHIIFHKEKSSKTCMLILTTLIFTIFVLVAFSQHYSNGYQFRDFTLKERLLSQGRIIYEYISLIIFPDMRRLGLYHDDYQISKNIFEPISTFFCGVFLISLLIIANLLKRKAPLFSFGIFWFFIGHSLESTVLSLELYFEHRNYLPSLGIWIACTGLVLHNLDRIKKYRSILFITLIPYLIFIVYSALYQSYLWGKPNLLAYQQAMDHPLSLRARYGLATAFMKSGDSQKAQDVIASHPLGNTDPEAIVRQWFIGCKSIDIALMPTLTINPKVNIQKWIMTINTIQKILEKPYCSNTMKQLAYTTLKNLSDNFPQREEFYFALGRHEYMTHNSHQAIRSLQAACKIKERPNTLKMLIELHDQLSLIQEKNDYVKKYNQLIENRFLYQLIYEKHPQ